MRRKNVLNLRPYCLRPGVVDPTYHPEICGWIPAKKGLVKLMDGTMLPLLRHTYAGLISPTESLAVVLTELASSDGASLEGEGIEGEGRIITNAGMRRLAGI
jgi:hypothetical protein